MTKNGGQGVAIRLTEVHKAIEGRPILKGVNLEVSYGEIVAIIGPNGSGKSLLLRIVSGLAYADEGEVVTGGQVIKAGLLGPLPEVGLMIEAPGFLPYLSGKDNLRLLATLRGRVGEAAIEAAMRAVGLDPRDRRPVRAYSMGMRQRLGIAQAIMEEPKILLLDEPTNGLDPEFTEEFLEMLRQKREYGVAILLTSHELHEVAAIASRTLRLVDGRLADGGLK